MSKKSNKFKLCELCDVGYFKEDPIKCVEDACLHSGEIEQILHHADRTYGEGHPILRDGQYDALVLYFEHLTGRRYAKIGHRPSAEHKKVNLPIHMGSLDKAKTDHALAGWVKKYSGPYVLSDKLDGISILAECQPGHSPRVFTRGDGRIGCNANALAPFIIGSNFKPEVLTYLRGELVFSKKKWPLVAAHSGYANPRNAVAGIVNKLSNVSNVSNLGNAPQVDPDFEKILELLDFVVFSVERPGEILPKTRQLAIAWTSGFKTVWNTTTDTISFNHLKEELTKRKSESAFAIDGLVLWDNNPHPMAQRGNPKHGIAFKMDQENQLRRTIIDRVSWNLTRYGLLKPVGHVAPVMINGTVISKVTLYNARWVQTNSIGAGAEIMIIKSGDVIPKVHSVIAPAPVAAVPEGDEGKRWRWKNKVDIELTGENPDVMARQLESFATKLKIAGLKIGTARKLVGAGIDTIPKFCATTSRELSGIGGIGKISANKLIGARDHALEQNSLLEVLAACNAFGQGFGLKKLKPLFSKFPLVLEKKIADAGQIETLPGWSRKSSTKFREALPSAVALAHQIKKAVPAFREATRKVSNFRLTVAFSGFRDKKMQEHLGQCGVHVASSVTKQCDYLVMRETGKETSKSRKAAKLGIARITTEKMMELAGNHMEVQ
jgi:DNA ligase (NAD+)